MKWLIPSREWLLAPTLQGYVDRGETVRWAREFTPESEKISYSVAYEYAKRKHDLQWRTSMRWTKTPTALNESCSMQKLSKSTARVTGCASPRKRQVDRESGVRDTSRFKFVSGQDILSHKIAGRRSGRNDTLIHLAVSSGVQNGVALVAA